MANVVVVGGQPFVLWPDLRVGLMLLQAFKHVFSVRREKLMVNPGVGEVIKRRHLEVVDEQALITRVFKQFFIVRCRATSVPWEMLRYQGLNRRPDDQPGWPPDLSRSTASKRASPYTMSSSW